MSTYIIGDVQGCYTELLQLLDVIYFDDKKDRLGFVGDLVSRGPDSLRTLRFIKNLNDPIVVLGNHDLHLLALGHGIIERDAHHSLQQVVNAPDADELLTWVRYQPILRYESQFNCAIVHAGIPPQWDVETALQHAHELETALRSDDFISFLKHMYGDTPDEWDDVLNGNDRLRYITNAFTRMRFCTSKGKLDLHIKDAPNDVDDKKLKAWYEWRNDDIDILFGHWAALEGHVDKPNIHALDTGCVWGGPMTALRLEDRKRFST